VGSSQLRLTMSDPDETLEPDQNAGGSYRSTVEFGELTAAQGHDFGDPRWIARTRTLYPDVILP